MLQIWQSFCPNHDNLWSCPMFSAPKNVYYSNSVLLYYCPSQWPVVTRATMRHKCMLLLKKIFSSTHLQYHHSHCVRVATEWTFTMVCIIFVQATRLHFPKCSPVNKGGSLTLLTNAPWPKVLITNRNVNQLLWINPSETTECVAYQNSNWRHIFRRKFTL